MAETTILSIAKATYALPRPRVAPVLGQDSATLLHHSCEGRHLLPSDCEEVDYLHERIETSMNRSAWRAKVASLT